MPGAVGRRRPGQVEQQAGADLVAVPGRVDGDGRHVGLVAAEHQAAVADHHPVDPGGHVVAAASAG